MPAHGRNKGPSERNLSNFQGPNTFNRPFRLDKSPLESLKSDVQSASDIPVDLTVSTLTVNGAAILASGADVNGASIINIGDPVDPGDVVSKGYVDDVVAHCPLDVETSIKSGDVITADAGQKGVILGGDKDSVRKLTINFPPNPSDGQCFKILSSVNVGEFSTDAKFARGNSIKKIQAGEPLHYTWNSETARWYRC